MKNGLRLVAIAALFLGFTNCVDDKPLPREPITVRIAEAAKDKKTPFLWRVESKKPTFLLGTLHMGIDAEKELPAIVWQSLAQSHVFAMETDLSKIDPGELTKYTMLPMKLSLRSLVGKDAFARLLRDLQPVTSKELDRLRPWYVSAIFLQRFFPKTAPMDLTLLKKAKAKGQRISYLENWQAQMRTMAALDIKATAESLKQNVTDQKEAQKLVNRMINEYREGDDGGLNELLDEGFAPVPGMRELLLDKRNRNWMPRIEEMIRRGDAFIAVGAGHLFGDEGLVALLRKRGYKIHRVASS